MFKSPFKRIKKLFNIKKHSHHQKRLQPSSTEDETDKDVFASLNAHYADLPQTEPSIDSKIEDVIVTRAEAQYQPSFTDSDHSKDVLDSGRDYEYLTEITPSEDKNTSLSDTDQEAQLQQPSLLAPEECKSKEAAVYHAEFQYLTQSVLSKESSGKSEDTDSRSRDDGINETGASPSYQHEDSSYVAVTYIALHDYVRAFQDIDFHAGIYIYTANELPCTRSINFVIRLHGQINFMVVN